MLRTLVRLGALGAAAMILALLVPLGGAIAQAKTSTHSSSQFTVFATGLNNPRGLNSVRMGISTSLKRDWEERTRPLDNASKCLALLALAPIPVASLLASPSSLPLEHAPPSRTICPQL